MSKWQNYSHQFEALTPREQYLIIGSGLVAIIFVLYTLFIDASLVRIEQLQQQIKQTEVSNKSQRESIQLLEQALTLDPNVALKNEIAHYEKKLAETDQALLALTSDLIDPIEMRYALSKLLKLQKGVKIISFEVLPAKAIHSQQDQQTNAKVKVVKTDASHTKPSDDVPDLHLYQHGIRIKLQGRYFQLRDYLTQLEGLSWTFFWQRFDYQLKTYPESELEIDIYSLSTSKEFIGV